jgi:hypothetical protein
MQSLPVDLVVVICGPEELFRLCLVSTHFRSLLNTKEMVDKSTTLHVPTYYTLPLPFVPVYFSGTMFGEFICRYDVLFISRRIGSYCSTTPACSTMRSILLASITSGCSDVISRVNYSMRLTTELMDNYSQYLTTVAECDNVEAFTFLFGLCGAGNIDEIVELLVKHTSVKITSYMVDLDLSHHVLYIGNECPPPYHGVTEMLGMKAVVCNNVIIEVLVKDKIRKKIGSERGILKGMVMGKRSDFGRRRVT